MAGKLAIKLSIDYNKRRRFYLFKVGLSNSDIDNDQVDQAFMFCLSKLSKLKSLIWKFQRNFANYNKLPLIVNSTKLNMM